MQESTIIKLVAILALVTIYIVDAYTFKIDHTVTILIVSAISGLAGYEIGKHYPKMSNNEQ